MASDELKLKIKEYALENATKFKGKAGQGAVVGKLMSFDPSIRQNMKDIAPIIGKIISEVNSMTPDEQISELNKLNPNFEKEKEEKKKSNKENRLELPPLKNAIQGEVITRMAPEPSKYSHIGHAISFLINYMYSQKYEGECILRFDDTNPEKESQEFVDSIKEDVLDYLDIKTSKTVFASDYNEKYIEIADKLIEENNAYTCNCEQADMSKNRRAMLDCPCRNKSVEENKEEWNKMKEGDSNSVLRMKIDMEHKNAVMRDPVIFRIINKEHYRQKDKFKVWPMYDFECALIEGDLKITHVMRTTEFETRIELQNHIRQICGFENNPEIKQYARFNVIGALTQGREVREKIESGEVSGWDDPRLVTLKALKRRGIVKEAFYELAKTIGMSKTNSELGFEVIAAINRKLLDNSAKRFFFIENKAEIEIKNAPSKTIELDMHPELDLGKRTFNLNTKYILEQKDLENFSEGETIRLIDNINFKDSEFQSETFEDFKGKGKKIIHFLPNDESQLTKVEIRMPDNTIKKGICEKNIEKLKIGEVIQFQRFGFCRLDEIKEGIYKFWFTHK